MSESITVGSILEGTVIRIKPFGAIVKLTEAEQGLVHISHISNKYVQDINDHIAVGDVVKVKVLSVDLENNKISLSIKETDGEIRRPPRSNSFFDNNESSSGGDAASTFEEKFKDWVKSSNERQAGLNKRNKRR